MKKITWTTEKRKLNKLILAKYNPRMATEKDIKDLTASINKFELCDPIIINKNNHVIGGHLRLKILNDKKVKEVDVRVPSRLLSLKEEQELNLRLNRNLGKWDYDSLANFDIEFLKSVGFEDFELSLDLNPKEKEIDENLETKNKCPKCGYEW